MNGFGQLFGTEKQAGFPLFRRFADYLSFVGVEFAVGNGNVHHPVKVFFGYAVCRLHKLIKFFQQVNAFGFVNFRLVHCF